MRPTEAAAGFLLGTGMLSPDVVTTNELTIELARKMARVRAVEMTGAARTRFFGSVQVPSSGGAGRSIICHATS